MFVQLNIFMWSSKRVAPSVISTTSGRPAPRERWSLPFLPFNKSFPSPTLGRKVAPREGAGALWERRRGLAAQLDRVCGEPTGEVRRCALVDGHLSQDGDRDLRGEGCEC